MSDERILPKEKFKWYADHSDEEGKVWITNCDGLTDIERYAQQLRDDLKAERERVESIKHYEEWYFEKCEEVDALAEKLQVAVESLEFAEEGVAAGYSDIGRMVEKGETPNADETMTMKLVFGTVLVRVRDTLARIQEEPAND